MPPSPSASASPWPPRGPGDVSEAWGAHLKTPVWALRQVPGWHIPGLKAPPVRWDAAGGWPSWDPMKPWAQEGPTAICKSAAVDHLPNRPSCGFWAAGSHSAPLRLLALCCLVVFSPFGLTYLGGCSKVGFPWRWRQRWGEGSQLIGGSRAPFTVGGAGASGVGTCSAHWDARPTAGHVIAGTWERN